MITELGHFALIMALAVTVVQAVVPLWGAYTGKVSLMRLAKPAARVQFVLLCISYASLTWAFVVSDFSVLYVAMHSNVATPMAYKIAGVWGSHEGSLLLWVLILSLWTVAVSYFSRGLPIEFLARVLSVLGWVSIGFLLFMLVTSNPFIRLLPAAVHGQDLNPLLQDPGMAIHPPLLYMGYVGFSIAYAFAMAALISGRLDAAWARWSRPWTTIAWVFLTAGIAVGSGWAYYELGWGGWWFWDPVENASFMPWLLGTALIHSLAVTEKRGAFRSWTVMLAIGTFSLSLLGTFLVRSGVLTSVHAFATDPNRGLFILVFLVAVIGTSLLIFAVRANTMSGGGSFTFFSRDTALLGNNVLLTAVMGSVFLGTLYPLFMDALDLGKISVGPPYFEAVFLPLMVPVVMLMMLGTFLRWKGDTVKRIATQLAPAFFLSVVASLLAAWTVQRFGWRTVTGFFLAAWVVISSIQLLWLRVKPRGMASISTNFARVPASWWGMWLAHLGVGLFVIGVTVVNTLEVSRDVRMNISEQVEFKGYSVTLENVLDVQGPNYEAVRGVLKINRGSQYINTLQPEKRLYINQDMPMTEASIDVGVFRDLYVALGERLDDGSWVVHLHFKPFISWIWLGCFLMFMGGILAVMDKRYRRLTQRKTSPATNTKKHEVATA